MNTFAACVTALATIALACVGFAIPLALDLEQRRQSAEAWTIQYYESVFNSDLGRTLEALGRKAEVFLWKAAGEIRKNNPSLSLQDVYKKADTQWGQELRRPNAIKKLTGWQSPGHDMRDVAMFLLHTAERLYECAGYGNFFDGGRLIDYGDDIWSRREVGYWKWIASHLPGQETIMLPLCGRDSAYMLFGPRLEEALIYLRTFLYCDEFIRSTYFREDDMNSPLQRLESVVMVTTAFDQQSRKSEEKDRLVIFRTEGDAKAYEKLHDGRNAINVRLKSSCELLNG